MVLDADVVREILFSNYGESPRFEKRLQGLVPVVGNGLITLEGKDWQRHRRIIHPSFQPGLIRESLGKFIPKVMTRFIGLWKKAEGREIDINTHLSHLTLDVIGEVAFSHEFHATDSVEQWASQTDDYEEKLDNVDDKVMEAMTLMFKNTGKRIIYNIFKISFLDFSTAKTSKMMDEAVEDVISVAQKKLEMKENLGNVDALNGETDGGENHRISLLQRLLDAEKSDTKTSARKKLAMNELRDEVKTFILAGHETTSTWCYWAVFALCKHPDIQQKLFDEINKHSPLDKNEDITIEILGKMSYFDAFMKEVLRMFPPAGLVFRYNKREEKFKGVNVPKGTRLAIPIHLLHRHPNYWEDPETFKPERWMGTEHPSSHKYAFMPFSNGPRNCIGSYFAELEAKLIMAPLIRQFSFNVAPSLRDTDFTFTTSITMKSKPFLKISIRSRDTTNVCA